MNYIGLKTVSCLVLETLQNLTDAKLHVPIVTLSTKDSVHLTKQLSERFKRFVYCKSYSAKPVKLIEKGKNLYELLNPSF